MPKPPGVSQRAAVRVLTKQGFVVERQSGHLVMSKGGVRIIVPRHTGIDALTMGGIAKKAGLTPDEFRRLL